MLLVKQLILVIISVCSAAIINTMNPVIMTSFEKMVIICLAYLVISDSVRNIERGT